ncbi:hypothetical protein Rsub_03753 [Raphidocelis subcapitata]|uniref:Uncharacterized protein n=1 Tax=Raphidocelis subcapitata TaxID=307507 RepID=A0A2V0NT90_9CHLO|nr:hypothetical protein Rsub_03753 [Raphidocelis subcapitata]|eukprot:GBF90898.1 hypothetical protein Rsub_03753 [Raphidocelis subcapitata]
MHTGAGSGLAAAHGTADGPERAGDEPQTAAGPVGAASPAAARAAAAAEAAPSCGPQPLASATAQPRASLTAALPPPLLHAVAACVLADRAGGLPALAALSRTCSALRAACDAALDQLTDLPRAATAPLRAKTGPEPGAAAALVRRAVCSLRRAVVVDLSGLHFWVFDCGLEALGSSCPMLEVLRLDHCQNISGAGLAAMAAPGRLARLRELSINACGDVGPGSFLAGLPALRVLRAQYCRSLEDGPVVAVAPRLDELDLTGCGLGDALCGALASARAAHLAFLPITDDGLAALGRAAPRLRRLTLAARCNNLWPVGLYSDSGVTALRRALPELEVAFTM